MFKRSHEDKTQSTGPPSKRFHNSPSYPPHHSGSDYPRKTVNYATNLAQLPPSSFPSSLALPSVDGLVFTNGIPDLPPLSKALASAPFKHKSTLTAYDRTDGASDLSYERLEFLGDAYLELFASRLIFSRYSHLPAGRMSQLRELLVKNETLAEYALLYGFEQKVEILDVQTLKNDAHGKKNKGFNKILGDVFEAYVAAVVMGGGDDVGSKRAEAWLTALWSVKLVEQQGRDDTLRPPPTFLANGSAEHLAPPYTNGPHAVQDHQEPSSTYSATAKSDLQRRIGAPEVKLQYEPYLASQELKGTQLGQTRHFVALYLTGYGYERKFLGQGEGKSKAEAGCRAAMEAMHGQNKRLIDECEAKLKLEKAERAKKKAQDYAEAEKLKQKQDKELALK